MKILWLCNTVVPEISKRLGLIASKPESWITGIYENIKKNDRISLIYLFPHKDSSLYIREGNIEFYSYTQKSQVDYEMNQVKEFRNIIARVSPDVIHIFGTEQPRALAMINACEEMQLLNRVVVSIQGLVHVIAKYYCANLPNIVTHKYTFRDIVRNSNIVKQKKQFHKRGNYEILAIKKIKYVIGRTDFDKAYIENINSKAQYCFCNEVLRPLFYEKKWEIEQCERHSIFLSQCNYPIEALKEVVKVYPDVHMYTTGKNPLTLSFSEKIRETYYSKYLGKLIKKYHLENNVTFLGCLDEKQMCERYIKSHVFVSPSVIENSSNSVGEAMILGVPTISSDVGGIKNQLIHEKEGFIYQADAPTMLSYYIKRIFENDELAKKISSNATSHARKTYNRDINTQVMMHIYNDIFDHEKLL